MESKRITNRLLGYPDDARLLIVNCDDFGMCHANNAGTVAALTEGIATSATLMAPCPWAPHAVQWLTEHPETAFGVHLTLIAEHELYRWGPLASRDRVSSLVDERGYFFLHRRGDEMLARAPLAEIEIEYRAQIEYVLAAGLKPTHLDSHCLYDGGRPDIFDLSVRLAREYGLAIRTHYPASRAACRELGLPSNDHGMLDSYSLDTADKAAKYTELLRALPAGLSEWAVHPSIGDGEAQAMEPTEWTIRRTDLDFVTSSDARDLVAAEGITLLNYRPLQQFWSAQ